MRSRDGAVLIEVIVALTILMLVAVTASSLGADSLRAVRVAIDADRSLRDASEFLDAVVLWPRDDLDRRLGERQQGPWRLRIDRDTKSLYTIVLLDDKTGMEILRTAAFRP